MAHSSIWSVLCCRWGTWLLHILLLCRCKPSWWLSTVDLLLQESGILSLTATQNALSVLTLGHHELVALVDNSARMVGRDHRLYDACLLRRYVVTLMHHSPQSIGLQAVTQRVLSLVSNLLIRLVLIHLLLHLFEVHLLLRLAHVCLLFCILRSSSGRSCWVGRTWHQIRSLRDCLYLLPFQAKLLKLQQLHVLLLLWWKVKSAVQNLTVIVWILLSRGNDTLGITLL